MAMGVRDTAEKIKMEAQLFFDEKGYEATTLREIAKKAGINAASLYYYYSSKEDLYIDLLKECQEYHNHEMLKLFDGTGQVDVEQELKLVYLGTVQLHMDNQVLSRFLLRNVFFPPNQLKSRIQSESIAWMGAGIPKLKELFQRGIEQGCIQPIPIPQLVQSFLAFQSGHMLLWMHLERMPTQEEMMQTWSCYWLGIKIKKNR